MGDDPRLDLPAELSLDRAIRVMAAAFAKGGIDTPLREARILLLHALDMRPEALILHGEYKLGRRAERLDALARRRLAREPMARITGSREFHGMHFALSDATLIPRPDTETVVDAILDHARMHGIDRRAATIIDLGVGSGAILAALLQAMPQARGIGIDLSAEAVATAQANLDRLCGAGRAHCHTGNWLAGLHGPFDVIVSNPPYIPSGDIHRLAPEVAHHDPTLALDGGTDGLDAYRALAQQAPSRLSPDGLLGLEIGIDQADSVTALFTGAGLRRIGMRADLGGIPRALIFARADQPPPLP